MNFSVLPFLLLVPMALFDSCTDRNRGVALGVTSRERVALTATASEIITELPVEEGSAVKVGIVLARLDDRVQAADVALAKAELAKAQANLSKLEAGARDEEIAVARADVEGARANLTNAESIYKRNLTLLQSGTVTEARLERDLAQRDSAQATLSRAREILLELENGTRPEDIQIAQAEVEAAQAKLEAEQRLLDNLVISASRDGWLDSLPWNLGERVAQGSPVAVLLASDVMLARVYVPEPYRVHLKEGDSLTVHVDGLDDPFDGVVSWISSDPAFTPYYALNQDERSRLMYMAEIALPEAAGTLPVGIPVQADLP